MKKTNNEKSAARRAVLSCLVGAAVVGLTQMAGAFAPPIPTAKSSSETCAFSLELQKSVSLRRQYLVKLEQALDGFAVAGSGVEEMYGSIEPAAYSDEDDSYGGGRRSIASFFSEKPPQKAVGMDSFSSECVSCHDGVGASSIGVVLRDRPFGRKPQVDSFTSDHPIGMTYNSYVASKRGYKAITIPNKMLFVNGKVGCLTCHDPLNPERGHLVMSDRNSALCTTCHDK
jgi:predicted CXXCH cytochrome family protein